MGPCCCIISYKKIKSGGFQCDDHGRYPLWGRLEKALIKEFSCLGEFGVWGASVVLQA